MDELAFAALSNLTDLELSNNRLSSLPVGVFKNLNRLKKLYVLTAIIIKVVLTLFPFALQRTQLQSAGDQLVHISWPAIAAEAATEGEQH